MSKTITAALSLATLLGLAFFQNCGKANFSSSNSSLNGGLGGLDPGVGATTPDGSASLLVQISPPNPLKGTDVTATVTMTGFQSADYACVTRAGAAPVAQGTVTAAQNTFGLTVNEDLNCRVTAVGVTPTLFVDHPIDVDCGNQIKAGGQCRDFTCTSVVSVTAAQLTSIPARGADGVCYSYKIMNQIANSPSANSGTHDNSLLARLHGGAPNTNAAPWLMGSVQGQFKLLGPRVVRLTGSASDVSAPILVDNFILTGVFPAGRAPDISNQYQALGTSDASTIVNGTGTGFVYLNQVPVRLKPFGTGGTGSVAAVDLTNAATPNVLQNFDVRALDCGGVRQLSDIYLLFR